MSNQDVARVWRSPAPCAPDLPLHAWSCEHGNYFVAQQRTPAPPEGIIALAGSGESEKP